MTFLNVAISYETWVHHFTVERKQFSMKQIQDGDTQKKAVIMFWEAKDVIQWISSIKTIT